MTQPYQLTATEAADLLARGELSVEELALSCLGRIRKLEATIGAWECLDEDLVMEQARGLDRLRREGGRDPRRMFGIPVGVKDIFNTRDMPTCMGSPIWAGFTPGNDARVVAEMRYNDAVIMGKTVTAEFAVHHPGKTVNPHDHARSPGTSSSGSAAAVATGMVPVALGTQTAGSTIRPASFCGVYGLKPSFGAVPRTGILKTLDTLDHVSFFGRSPEDLEMIFETVRVRGRNYPFVHRSLDDDAAQDHDGDWKVAFVKTGVWDQAEPYVQRAMEDFARRLDATAGVRVSVTDLPEAMSDAHAVHTEIYESSLSYYFKDEYDNDRDRISPIMREMIERGRTIGMERLRAGLKRQNELAETLDGFLSGYDIVLSHSTAHEALIGLDSIENRDPCLIWTLCRAPSINLPAFTGPNGLPFGAQVVARRYRDRKLLTFARMLRDSGLVGAAPNPTLPGMRG